MHEEQKRIEIENGIWITNDFCLFLDERKGEKETAVIADLHLGFEAVMQEQGVAVPSLQKELIVERLETIINNYQPEKIVIAGDLKHEFSRNLHQEWKEVGDIVDYLREKVEVQIVRGNHDNYLMNILAKRGMELPYELMVGKNKVTHGHMNILNGQDDDGEGGWLIIGHEHSSITLRDDVGTPFKLPCFVVFQELKIVVLPAFSPLASGTDVAYMGRFISPVLSDVDWKKGLAFAISETGLLEMPLGAIEAARASTPDY